MAYKNVNVDISITPISSYNDLNNKPSINGVELDGNLSSEELDIKVDTTDIENNISTIKNDLDELGDQVSEIESKIPAESSDSNQLTDKLYLHNNFYTKTQVDQTVELKVNRNELNDYATKQQLETKQDKLTAGDNITIENGIISSTGTSSEVPNNVYTTDNLIAGKNVTFTEVLPEGGIDEHTLACWHFDGDNIDVVNGISLGSSVQTSFFKFAPGCSYGNGYQSFINLPFAFSSTQDFSFDLWYLRYASNGDGEIGLKDGKGYYHTMWFYINHMGQVQCKHNDTMSDVVATIPQSKWTHLYAHHKAETNTYEYFIDGKKVYSAVDETLFGDRKQFSVASYYNAYKDEVRISDCVRWTEDFTPPTEPYTLATGPSKTAVNATIPTKTSELENDSNFVTIEQLSLKQDKLTAGSNITISEEGVISAVGGSSSELPTDIYTKTNLVAGTNIEIVNPTSGDSNTVALWHFEGNNVDEVSGLALNSHNKLNTNTSKFGSGSLYTSMMGTTYSTIPAVTYDKDFTVECWQYKASGGTFYLGFRGENILSIYTSQNVLNFNGSSNWEDTTTVSLSSYDTGIWHHWALSYVASTRTMYVYLNGVRVASRGIVSDFSITGLVLGSTNGTDLVDELRISNIARYTSDSFELQTEPFTLSSTDTSKSVINSTITKLSQLENDSSFLTELPTNLVNTDEEQTITSLKHFQGGIDLPINSEFMVANGTTVFKHNGSRLLMGATTDLLTIRSIGTPKINRDGTDYENIDSGNISEFVNTNNSSDYELPTASTTTLGGVKVDGTTITIDGNGVIRSTVTSNGENSIGGPATWGNITGDISSQSDLQEELNKKVNGVGITSVIRLTQDEYDSLQSIDENAQYIIVGETSTQGGEYISTSSVVTSLDENVTDDQIPSAKLVYDLFMSVEQQLSEI